jgi:hypothetical protein
MYVIAKGLKFFAQYLRRTAFPGTATRTGVLHCGCATLFGVASSGKASYPHRNVINYILPLIAY